MTREVWIVALASSCAFAAIAFGQPPGIVLSVLAAIVFGILFRMATLREMREPEGARPSHQGIASTEATITSIVALVDVIEAPALLLDEALEILAINPVAQELFPQAQLGEPLSPAVRNPELLSALTTVIATASGRTVQIAVRIPFERRLHAILTPLKIASDVPADGSESSFLLLQFRDLTEQDRLAQMRSDFIANASHELRTPLASLRGFIETLRGAARDDAEARDKFLPIMEQQASRMSRILDDLLSLSRIEMRTHLQPSSIVSLAEIVNNAVNGLGPLAKDANIAINVSAQADAFNTRGDFDELEQVFQNLIQNAIKYGQTGGRIDVTLERLAAKGSRPERIAVRVADDGPGIAEEHLPRLTERFYRVDTGASRARGGTGLGLAIVKHILTRHRADLDVASKLGEGSTFSVVIDAAPPSHLLENKSKVAHID